jgi:hypothetical protein
MGAAQSASLGDVSVSVGAIVRTATDRAGSAPTTASRLEEDDVAPLVAHPAERSRPLIGAWLGPMTKRHLANVMSGI